MEPKSTLTTADLRRLVMVYHRLLGEHREHLNALNVYPVPDADTGTNLYSTVGGVVDSLPAEDDMIHLCRSIRGGAMLGARGASGVITSQLLGALVGCFEQERIDGRCLAAGLIAASAAADGAVLKPVEGTILTVLRAAAEAANKAGAREGGSLFEVVEAARFAAGISLDETPDLLPELKAAGVVDAGGYGFVLFLDALLHVVAARALPEAPAIGTSPPAAPIPTDMPRYEVVVRLDAPSEVMGDFRAVWERLGNESTVVVESDGDWVSHIHTNNPDAAIEAARAAGQVHDAQVTDLVEQIMQLKAGHADGAAVVAVAVGNGLQEWFLSRGATGVVAGGASRNPSTAELLQAVETTGAQTVIILPNDENVVPAANQVAELTQRAVIVVPTLSIPAGMTALRHFDPALEDGGADGMTRAAEAVTDGGITRAVREADSPVGRIAQGAWITMSGDGSVSTASTLGDALAGLLDHLVGALQPARIAIIAGDGSDAGVTDEACRHIAAHWPGADLVVIDGGQPYYPYLIGVESAIASRSR